MTQWLNPNAKALVRAADDSDPYGVNEATPLPAGRELDALVATKVMGWEVFDLGYFGTDDETPRMREMRNWLDEVGIESVGLYYINVAENFWVESLDFEPSTEIADAWLVVERMRESWADFILQFVEDDQPGDGWFAKFHLTRSPQHAQAAPLAICLAALAAIAAPPSSRPVRPARASGSSDRE